MSCFQHQSLSGKHSRMFHSPIPLTLRKAARTAVPDHAELGVPAVGEHRRVWSAVNVWTFVSCSVLLPYRMVSHRPTEESGKEEEGRCIPGRSGALEPGKESTGKSATPDAAFGEVLQ